MSNNKQGSHKYIKICERSVRVKIERGEDAHLKHFRIRKYPSLAEALIAALSWRDEKHLKEYGVPVLEKVHQVKPRTKRQTHLDPNTGERLPELPPGLSWGYHRGKLLYVVATYQEEMTTKKKRFPIKDRDLTSVIMKATEFRVVKLSEGL